MDPRPAMEALFVSLPRAPFPGMRERVDLATLRTRKPMVLPCTLVASPWAPLPGTVHPLIQLDDPLPSGDGPLAWGLGRFHITEAAPTPGALAWRVRGEVIHDPPTGQAEVETRDRITTLLDRIGGMLDLGLATATLARMEPEDFSWVLAGSGMLGSEVQRRCFQVPDVESRLALIEASTRSVLQRTVLLGKRLAWQRQRKLIQLARP